MVCNFSSSGTVHYADKKDTQAVHPPIIEKSAQRSKGRLFHHS